MQRASNPFDAQADDDELPDHTVTREEQLYLYLKKLGTTPRDYYSLLNLPQSSTVKDVHSAYKRLCKTFHPDKFTQEEDKARADKLFNEIQEAYTVLSDPRKKSIYDNVGPLGLKETVLTQYDHTADEIKEIFSQLERLRKQDREAKDFRQEGEWQFPPAALRISQRLEKRFGSYRWNLGLQVTPDVTNRDDTYRPLGRTVVVSQEATLGVNHLQEQTGAEECGVAISAQRFTMHSATMLNGRNRDTLIGANVFWFPQIGAATFVARYLYTMTPHTHLVVDSGLLNDTSVTLRWNKVPLNASLKKQKNATVGVTVRGDSISLVGKKILSERSKVKSEALFMQGRVRLSIDVERLFTPDLALGLSLVRDDNVILLIGKANIKNQKLFVPVPLWSFSTSSFVGALLSFFAIVRIIKVAFIMPLENSIKRKKLAKTQKRYRSVMEQAKKRAQDAKELMEDTVKNRRQREEATRGLIIVEATYGHHDDKFPEKSIDVTTALQYQVENSELHLFETTKANLPGFYDPALGEDKSLRIRYLYRDRLHDVEVDDDEGLLLPSDTDKEAQ